MVARAKLTPRGLGRAGQLMALGIDEIPGAAVVVFDRDFRYLLYRGKALANVRVSTSDAEGHLASEVLPPEIWATFEPIYRAALGGQETTLELESQDGEHLYLIRTAGVRDPVDGQIIGGASVVTDVTALRSAERARAASERRSRLTFDSAPIGMALEDLDGRFLEVNPALSEMLGRRAEALLGRCLGDLLDPAEEAADRRLRDAMRSGELESGSEERCLQRPDGTVIWVLHSVRLLADDQGSAQHYVSHYLDVTDARAARERMAHLATHDELTGLLNRAGFVAAVAPMLAHPVRVGAGLALLFVDLDDFKHVNDSHGHTGGDLVLAVVGARIRAALRSDDLVARFGGDEFVVLLTGLSRDSDAQVVADQVHEQVGTDIEVDGHRIRVRLSIGLVLVGPDEVAGDALKRADLSMYRAKALGGGQTVLAG